MAAMDKVLLDTDILSEILKARDAIVVTRAATYRKSYDSFTISVVAIMEITKGFHKTGETNALNRFIQAITGSEVLVFDQASAEIAGRLFADLELAGRPIGRADIIVASIALRHNLPLATGNTRHFQFIQEVGHNLKLENWREATMT